ncbi:hypothetical protein [Tenuibacillus multivorans]|uniref:Uncharacterized protein n=1 Tax=Tenuibacillus multivorans TaxID=237069 RepID=A0A1H0G0N2_9BACI|nr:hypothetical protein [Tenuibacillus multivorans]GEL78129.1 hypothetical protein TMU01_23640 [Tenuibacillus multivorans]SDO00488.1 hypothetical protein SAMN05216498_0427 [Tenuibacillus multivorans]
MELFGRGCLYSLIFVGVMFVLAIMAGGHITIPWFIFLPIIAFIWYLAYKKTNEKD